MERLLAERACERLILDFVHRLDLGEPSSVAELFTEDGVWRWPHDGHYEDTFRRAGGAWLLASRTLHLPFGGPTPRPNVPPS